MKRDWWDKEFKTLLAVGESTTAGAWASCRERRWTDLLAAMINDYQRHPVQLVNVGIGANVISTRSPYYELSSKPVLSERLEQHVLSNTANGSLIVPDLLIISYGQNDASTGTPVELFCSEMEEIIRRIRERIQPLIVLAGPYYVSDFTVGGPACSFGNLQIFRDYNESMRKMAERLDCLFVDLLSAYGEADWLVHHDGVHANDIGHRVVANRIFEVLASNCSGMYDSRM